MSIFGCCLWDSDSRSLLCRRQVVGGKLFTGSYDGFLKVWDSTGIKDETTFGKEEKKEDKEKDKKQQKVDSNQNGIDNKIMIDWQQGKYR